MKKFYLLLISLVLLLLSLSLNSQIVINEIDPANDRVELKNIGNTTVNVASYWLCDRPQYDQIGSLGVFCGSTNMAPGDILVVNTGSIGISGNDGEMGLYINSSFASSNSIIDYVEWGSSGHGRSSVAVNAGIWTAGDFVPSFANTSSIEYGGSEDCSNVWTEQPNPTLCNENSNLGGSCANCSITGGGLSNIQCDNNNTNTNPADDIISFDLNPSGTDLGTSYSVSVSQGTISPATGNYGAATSFELNNGSAGGGDVVVTITDDNDGTCTLDVTVTDPGSCSNDCTLETDGLASVICNDNGTTSDATDDFISFDLNPGGSNLGTSYSVSVSQGTISPATGNYGAATSFALNGGSAGGGDVVVTITDDNDGTCTLDVTVTDPGSCSDDCTLETDGLASVSCNDNGTTSDATDDFISFDLNPGGSNLGTSYSVSVSQGTISPATGNYGAATSFALNGGSAGGGDVVVTITDDNDGTCTLDVTVTDPGSCSDDCTLETDGLASVSCNDNGTTSDATDDFISFDLNPGGSNLGTSYSVSVSQGAISPATGNYGAATSFELNNGSAGGGDVVVTITDDNDGTCTLDVTVTDPGSCSDDCTLETDGLASVICNDNGTTSDAADDFISFDLNPGGSNLGTSYSVSVSQGAISPATGNYGAATSFELNNGSAGGGDVVVTITDDNDGTCTLDVTVTDPGSCSDDCTLETDGLASVICNDNGTTSDATDDFISFDLNPGGSNLGTSYSVSVSQGAISPATGNYGAATSFELNNGSAGGGDVVVTITDDNDGTCTLDVTVTDPGSCSDDCTLETDGLASVICNDNGTTSDATDDFISFDLNPGGSNLGTSYSVGVSQGTISPATSNYGAATSFALNGGSAGGGDVVVTITDDNDGTCTLDVTVTDPGSCSDDCTLETDGLASVICNDNGTTSDATDDFISFDLNPGGSNLGTSYSVSVSQGTISPAIGNYGAATSFELNNGSAGGGDVVVTITDDNDGTCTLDVTVTDPGSCSNDCTLETDGLASVSCNDNGTTSDATDDFISFDLNPGGSNLGTSYSVSVSQGTISPATGNYGAATSFALNGGSAGGGDVVVTITDATNSICTMSVEIVDPGSCSSICNIDSSGLSAVICNSNGTSDATDDFISFELDPKGSNLGTSYSIQVDPGSTTTVNGGYGAVTNWRMQDGSAGGGDVVVTITDVQDGECDLVFTLTDPGSCSEDICDAIGGSITLEGDTSICVTDTIGGVIIPVTDGSGSFYSFVLIDENGNIRGLFTDSTDLKLLEAGTYTLVGIASDQSIEGINHQDDLDQLQCIDLSENTIQIMVLEEGSCTSGIDELDDIVVKVFPNPSTGKVNVELPDQLQDSYSLLVFNLFGQKILSQEIENGNRAILNMEGVDPGLYLIRIGTGYRYVIRKLVIE